MSVGCVRYLGIFLQLVATNLVIARKGLWDQIINLYIWSAITLVIMGYIMQNFGLSSGYGAFQCASIVSIVGLFEVYNTATKTIMDIGNDRNISYYLTLPTRPAVVLLSMACSYALISILLTAVLLPFGSLVLYNSFSIASISWFKFIIVALLANIFFAIFTLAMIAYVGEISKMRNIWMRFIWPLWFLGCYQFSWQAIYSLSAVCGYMVLCNPITFITEGVRGTLLGASGFLPWEVCCGALCCYIMICWCYAYYKMKRLLDFV
jgi:hypothetical protein